jgi:hypothetical protein
MLQACVYKDVACLNAWAQKNKIDLSYVYLSDQNANESPLQQSLASSPDYELAYRGPGPKIYKRHTTSSTF